MMKDKVLAKHRELFGEPDIVVKSPGRANIIGEHTDYNDGFVLPFAIDKCIYMAATKSDADSSSVYALDTDIFEENIEQRTDGFLQYFQSVLKYFKSTEQEVGHFNLSFGGNLPIGAGVSSSSAITCGFIRVCQEFLGSTMSKIDIVKLASIAERGAGLEGGIMDQFTIVHGEANKVICLDCADSSWFELTIDTGRYEFVLINTNVEHQLADTAYNVRVTECKEGLAVIQQRENSVQGFRDIQHHHLSYLDSPSQERLKHVIEENDRVRASVDAIRNQDMERLGLLLNQSHASLRDLYEVSCEELNYVADQLSKNPKVAGARMMGGGFGGCVIALVEKDSIEEIVKPWKEEYNRKFNRKISWFKIHPAGGLEVIN